jgi:hypothetical protein
MYTLLGAPLLGFDLARRPGGADVADLVRTALALDADRLSELGAAAGDDGIGWVERARGSAPGAGGGQLASALRDTARLVGEGRVEEALRRLETAAVAGLPELVGVVRDEVFDWTWSDESGTRSQPEELRRGVVVACDAIVAAWHAATLSPAFAAQLAAPYLRVAPRLPTPSLGPCQDAVLGLLAGVAAADDALLRDLADAADRARELGAWGPSMHSATWAVQLAGRDRAAAAAQMQAVRALTMAGVDAAQAAAGTWNLVSGACQALVVGDLLDTLTLHRLADPVTEVLGPLHP